ncbi:hypothetical protein [Spirosoma luteum]|uniref:hypothetical protein n=1 Tax=Spirosoma luteum TaxID=431553 RepID=UPI00036F2037|nr:hypothetical protein [Spirosoma luteum]
MSYPQDPRPAIIARANEIAAKHLQHRAANPLPQPVSFRLYDVLSGLGSYWSVEQVNNYMGTFTLVECDKEGEPLDDPETINEYSRVSITAPGWAVHIPRPRFRDFAMDCLSEYKWWLVVGLCVIWWMV